MTGTALFTTLVQNTPAWVDARRNFIGSSDLPIITGNSPYRTSIVALWAIKSGLLPDETPDADTQELFDLGHSIEPVIADRYTRMTGRPLKRVPRMLVHREHPWASCSLDRVSAVRGERIIVEVKWRPHRTDFDKGDEAVPPGVQDQVQWQMFVTGYPMAHVVVLSGSKVSWYEVAADPGYQADLLWLAQDFRRHVTEGIRPEVDGSESTRETLTRLHPRETLDLLEPTVELDALAEDLRLAREAAKVADAESERLANVVRSVIGDHEGVKTDAYRITWTKNKDSRKTDWKEVALDLSHLVESQMEGGAVLVEDAVIAHTQTVEGARVLRSYFYDEGSAKWY